METKNLIQEFLHLGVLIAGLLPFLTILFIQKIVCDRTVLRFWWVIFILLPIGLTSLWKIEPQYVPISVIAMSLFGSFIMVFVLPGKDSLAPLKIKRNIFIFFNLAIWMLFTILGSLPFFIAGFIGIVLGLPTIYFWRMKYFKKNKLSNRAHFHGYD